MINNQYFDLFGNPCEPPTIKEFVTVAEVKQMEIDIYHSKEVFQPFGSCTDADQWIAHQCGNCKLCYENKDDAIAPTVHLVNGFDKDDKEDCGKNCIGFFALQVGYTSSTIPISIAKWIAGENYEDHFQ